MEKIRRNSESLSTSKDIASSAEYPFASLSRHQLVHFKVNIENFVLANMNIDSNVNVESWMSSLMVFQEEQPSGEKSTIIENCMANILRQFLVGVPCVVHERKKRDIDLSPLTGSTLICPDVMLTYSHFETPMMFIEVHSKPAKEGYISTIEKVILNTIEVVF